jgi:hypothetical protein
MKFSMAAALAFVAVAAAGDPAVAASTTTCLCRTDDGAAFKEKTHRHHRWACDYKLGYVKKDGDDDDQNENKSSRPSTQTCNSEEIIQYKIWACVQRGCTYQYTQRLETKNPKVEVIEQLEGQRRP